MKIPDKVLKIAKIEGYADPMEMLEKFVVDSVVTGICVNPYNYDCDYTCDVEPDSDSGWCEECHENTVKSPLVLMEII